MDQKTKSAIRDGFDVLLLIAAVSLSIYWGYTKPMIICILFYLSIV